MDHGAVPATLLNGCVLRARGLAFGVVHGPHSTSLALSVHDAQAVDLAGRWYHRTMSASSPPPPAQRRPFSHLRDVPGHHVHTLAHPRARPPGSPHPMASSAHTRHRPHTHTQRRATP